MFEGIIRDTINRYRIGMSARLSSVLEKKMDFKIRVADLNIGICAQYSEIVQLCRDYLIPMQEETEFSVGASRKEMEREGASSVERRFRPEYLETLAVQRMISEKLPIYQRFLMHGAVIAYQEKGYLFTAPSGTGKSTHIRLWKEYLGEDVQIVNGDKPFLWVKEEEVLVYGTPWAGKEGWQKNWKVPLAGICFLERGEKNSIRRVLPETELVRLMKQIYLPERAEAAGATLELLNRMLMQIPLYRLECDRSELAVKTSFEAMTGKVYVKSDVIG